MLHLYYGRENVDKDRFLFDAVDAELNASGAADGHHVFLLVPDQFTLQMERNAFAYLKAPGLMDLEILSQTRLGLRILSETGGVTRTHIDRLGRHMLLSRIIRRERERLRMFQGMERSGTFVEMVNDLISELKQYNAAPEDLEAIAEKSGENPILAQKLEDIRLIYSCYEKEIAGKYVDSEDYMKLLADAVSRSELVKGASFWVTGFHSFTPKTLDLLEELLVYAADVNVILTGQEKATGRDGDLFRLSRDMMNRLEQRAERKNCPWTETEIKSGKRFFAPEFAHLERELYAYPFKTWNETERKGGFPVHLCQAGNFSGEAETAAAEISRLVREEGLRYREIAVICNDMEVRGAEAGRIFRKYGIPVFFDEKRGILHNPVVTLILALLDILGENWRYEDVFRFVKTGFAGGEDCRWEDLENYVLKYKISGKRWKKEFTYGVSELGEDGLECLNQYRKALTDIIAPLETAWEQSADVKEKTAALYFYLRDRLQIPEQLEIITADLKESGEAELAEETAQIWDVIIHLFDQLTELIGDEELSREEFSEVLKAGFEAAEVGMIPPVIDQVLMGTMQRTRSGRIKVLFVLGANDGLLPMGNADSGILNEEERSLLLGSHYEICKDYGQRDMEEKLAIYKNLTGAESCLWISWSAADGEGKELRPSMIVEKVRDIFPKLAVEKDVFNRGDVWCLLQRPESSLDHLTQAFQSSIREDEEPDEIWQTAYRWYERKEPKKLELIRRGLLYRNREKRLPESLARELYCKDESRTLTLSPSKLERYSRCPFSYFVTFGLRPEERRIFEVAGREIGDVYHQCLREFAEGLTLQGMDVTDPESPWMTLTREDSDDKVEAIMGRIARCYREGVLYSGEEELYRTKRITEVCQNAAWALAEQVKRGEISRMQFELPFGRASGKPLPAVEINTQQGTVFIEGIIDRVDILPGDYVKILDYKSGGESFYAKEARQGWKLQLMLYLRAVTEGSRLRGKEMQPAGVFYFRIANPSFEVDAKARNERNDEHEQKILRSFRLDGVVLDDPAVIRSLAGEFTSSSEILPLRNTKEGIKGTGGETLLSDEEFKELQETVKRTVDEICSSLAKGTADVSPKKSGEITACTYCPNKNICNFELTFDGCRYHVVK